MSEQPETLEKSAESIASDFVASLGLIEIVLGGLALYCHYVSRRGQCPGPESNRCPRDFQSRARRRRRALAITETELRLMAALAIIGDRRRRRRG
jgi:hypothetical protein